MAKELIHDSFLVDGVAHVWTPSVFNTSPLKQPLGTRYEMLNLKRMVVQTVGGRSYTGQKIRNNRKSPLQTFSAEWDFMDLCMSDQLKVLYSTGKEFFIQFDDEMSKVAAVLENPSGDRQTFITPTYPIAPFGDTPNEPQHHGRNLYMHDSDTGLFIQLIGGFTVNDEYGIVYLSNKVKPTVTLFFDYTWRAKVRIASLNLSSSEVAQANISGSVVFEQVQLTGLENPRWQPSACENPCATLRGFPGEVLPGEVLPLPGVTTPVDDVPPDMELPPPSVVCVDTFAPGEFGMLFDVAPAQFTTTSSAPANPCPNGNAVGSATAFGATTYSHSMGAGCPQKAADPSSASVDYTARVTIRAIWNNLGGIRPDVVLVSIRSRVVAFASGSSETRSVNNGLGALPVFDDSQPPGASITADSTGNIALLFGTRPGDGAWVGEGSFDIFARASASWVPPSPPPGLNVYGWASAHYSVSITLGSVQPCPPPNGGGGGSQGVASF